MLVSHWNHTNRRMVNYLRSFNALENIEVRWFVVPELVELEPVPYTRVNHAKFMVADDEACVTTNNWSADYFLNTAGITLVVRNQDFASQLRQRFDRDWASPYTVKVV
jgi:phospholipase D3/4